MKFKSHPQPIANFECNSESVKSNKSFYSKKHQSDNHTNNKEMCIDCLKPRSNKNELKGKKCDCNELFSIFSCIKMAALSIL